MLTDDGDFYIPFPNNQNHCDGYCKVITNLFKKFYKFEKDPYWVLPRPRDSFLFPIWHIDRLQKIKADLNNTKKKLDNIDSVDWSAHTRATNPTGHINKRIEDEMKPEFLTRSWTKFYECANKYYIIPKYAEEDKKLLSLHLCEAPGTFLAAFNQYLKTYYKDIEWNWRASSLNPYYEGNSTSNYDDRLMLHTLDHWDFGVDESGNIMDWKNSQSIIENVKKLGEVMLVTADGSIDCIENPEDEEDINSALHFCEAVTALQALSEGGTFVLRLFTLLEHTTINLLYLFNNCFEEVNVNKPVTSKLDSSEVYVVCRKYKGSALLQPYMPMIQEAYGTDVYKNKTLFRLEMLPSTFLDSMYLCANMFNNFQTEVINNNLETFEQEGISYIHLQKNMEIISSKFIYWFELRPVDPSKRILKGNSEVTRFNLYSNQDFYAERPFHTLSPFEKFDVLKINMERNIMKLKDDFINDGFLQTYGNCFHGNDVGDLELEFIIGPAVSVINSSKFIYSQNLEMYLQITTDEFRRIILDRQKRMISIDELATAPGDMMCDDDPHTHYLLFPNENCEDTFDMYEKQCFKLLHRRCLKLRIGDDLYLSNMNLLTHFSVGLLNVLLKFFKYIRFEDKFRILLKHFVNPRLFSELDKIASEVNSVLPDNYVYDKVFVDFYVTVEQKTVLRILPISQTNTGKMYDRIIVYNSQLYQYKSKKYLEIIGKYMAEFYK